MAPDAFVKTVQTQRRQPNISNVVVRPSQELPYHSSRGHHRSEYRFARLPLGRAELIYRLLNFSVLRRDVVVLHGGPITADAVLALSLSADVIATGAATFRNVADIENPADGSARCPITMMDPGYDRTTIVSEHCDSVLSGCRQDGGTLLRGGNAWALTCIKWRRT